MVVCLRVAHWVFQRSCAFLTFARADWSLKGGARDMTIGCCAQVSHTIRIGSVRYSMWYNSRNQTNVIRMSHR